MDNVQLQNVQVQPLNTPTKPESSGAATGRNQKDRRYVDTFFDIHRHPTARGGKFIMGRPWCGPREIAANRDVVPPPEDGFCIADLMQGHAVQNEDGTMDRGASLASAWTAPWKPFSKYFRFNYKRKTISFEYAKMRLDEQMGLDAYWKAASKLANRIGLTIREGGFPPGQIVDELGEPSRMVKIAEAAMAGDPWLLGFIDDPNPALADILNIPTERGIVSLAQPIYEPTVTQAQKVEAVIAAPPSADILQILAQLSQNMAAMQQQITSMDADRAKRSAHGAKIKAGHARRKASLSSTPAQGAAT